MKTRHLKVYLIGAGIALLLSAAIGHAQITGRTTAPPQAGPSQQGQAAVNRQAMMADMQAQQKRLDDLVAQMNASRGSDKVDRIAAVVNEMAAMHTRMSTMMMQGGMMQGGMMPAQ